MDYDTQATTIPALALFGDCAFSQIFDNKNVGRLYRHKCVIMPVSSNGSLRVWVYATNDHIFDTFVLRHLVHGIPEPKLYESRLQLLQLSATRFLQDITLAKPKIS